MANTRDITECLQLYTEKNYKEGLKLHKFRSLFEHLDSGEPFDVGGLKFIPTGESFWVEYMHSKGEFFEPTELWFIRDWLVKHPGPVLDIGANVGNHSIALSKYATVIPMETDPKFIKILKKNAELNNVRLDESLLGRHASKYTTWPELKVSVIKIDVDGPALEILESLEDVIRKNKPLVMIESYNEEKHRLNHEIAPKLGIRQIGYAKYHKYKNIFLQ